MSPLQKWQVTRAVCARIPTEYGEFQLHLYTNNHDEKEHLALVMGEISGQQNVLVRVHSECFTGDVLGSRRCDCGEQLLLAMRLIAEAGAGIIVYLRQEGRGIGLQEKLRAYNLQDQGFDTVEANLLLGHQADARDYTVAARILEDLEVSSIQLLTNNPLKIEGLRNMGIRVNKRIPLQTTVYPDNSSYLRAKAERMRHLLVFGFLQNGFSPAQPVHGPVWEQIESRLAQAAAHREQTGRPYVTLSYAQSLDGSIAAHGGSPLLLSGKQSLILTHYLRASHEAILVGIGTVLADNPQLNVRLVRGDDPQPVVVDSRLRFPLNAQLLKHQQRRPWIATSVQADPIREAVLEAAGVQIFRFPPLSNGQIDLRPLLEQLGSSGIDRLMIEGGAQIITSFLNARLVDHLVLTIAPVFVGGLRSIKTLHHPEPSNFPRLRQLTSQQLGEDLIVSGDLDWQAE